MKSTLYPAFQMPLRETNGDVLGGGFAPGKDIWKKTEAEVLEESQRTSQVEVLGKGFNLKEFFNLLTSNPTKAFKEQPIATIVVLLVVLKLTKVI